MKSRRRYRLFDGLQELYEKFRPTERSKGRLIPTGEQMSRGPYSANHLPACSKSLGGKNLTRARRTHAPAKESAGVSQRGSATMAILEIFSRHARR